jgi:hypothetical protein
VKRTALNFFDHSPEVYLVYGRGCRFFNAWSNDPVRRVRNPLIELEFEPELPQSLLRHKPLYMLIQVADQEHLRVGFKAAQADPWLFSRPFDTAPALGKIAKFAYPALVSFQGGLLGTNPFSAHPPELLDSKRLAANQFCRFGRANRHRYLSYHNDLRRGIRARCAEGGDQGVGSRELSWISKDSDRLRLLSLWAVALALGSQGVPS